MDPLRVYALGLVVRMVLVQGVRLVRLVVSLDSWGVVDLADLVSLGLVDLAVLVDPAWAVGNLLVFFPLAVSLGPLSVNDGADWVLGLVALVVPAQSIGGLLQILFPQLVVSLDPLSVMDMGMVPVGLDVRVDSSQIVGGALLLLRLIISLGP